MSLGVTYLSPQRLGFDITFRYVILSVAKDLRLGHNKRCRRIPPRWSHEAPMSSFQTSG